MNLPKLSLTIFAMILLFMSACVTENKETTGPITEGQLTGKWDLVNAMRNGKETQSLEGTVIHIRGNKMSCNFTGEEVETELNFTDNQLKQNTQTYKIIRLTNDSLLINTELMNFQFEMTFVKAK